MIRINLLPYREAARKENIKRQISIIAGSFVVFLLCLIYVHVTLNSSVSALEEKIKEKEDRLVVLTKTLGDIEGFKKNKEELEQKLAVIRGLEENRSFHVRLMAELSQMVPSNNLWLTKLTEAGNEISIEGIARNNVVVAGFMKQLELSDFVSSINLVHTKEADISGFKLQQFTLSCVLKKG